ncbi:MAG TPA: STAS domain-containing protein [Thermoanaerobaculia bacterium]|nr:STAS domain-containing protein [Thermoanaerobaculia bacterium]
MELTYEDSAEGIRLIRLAGRMDVEGTHEIDLKFTSVASCQKLLVLVDMSLVEFLSSLGLGTLVRSAKAQMSRTGMLVLYSPTPAVARVLQATQIDQIVPVYYDLGEARRALVPGGVPSV